MKAFRALVLALTSLAIVGSAHAQATLTYSASVTPGIAGYIPLRAPCTVAVTGGTPTAGGGISNGFCSAPGTFSPIGNPPITALSYVDNSGPGNFVYEIEVTCPPNGCNNGTSVVATGTSLPSSPVAVFIPATAPSAPLPPISLSLTVNEPSSARLPVQPTLAHPLAASCSTYTSTVSCAYPLNVTAGNIAYVLVIASAGGGTFSGVACAGTATVGTFSPIGAGASLGGGAVAQWYSAAITSSGSCTVSATYSAGANVAVFPYEVSNSNGPDSGVNPVYNSNTTYCTACSMVAITTSTTNDLLLYGQQQGGYAETYSAVTPYSVLSQSSKLGNNQSFLIAGYTASAAGSVSGTFTQTTGYPFVEGLLAIK